MKPSTSTRKQNGIIFGAYACSYSLLITSKSSISPYIVLAKAAEGSKKITQFFKPHSAGTKITDQYSVQMERKRDSDDSSSNSEDSIFSSEEEENDSITSSPFSQESTLEYSASTQSPALLQQLTLDYGAQTTSVLSTSIPKQQRKRKPLDSPINDDDDSETHLPSKKRKSDDDTTEEEKEFPDLTLELIFCQIPFQHLISSCRLVCRRWNEIIMREMVWLFICMISSNLVLI